MKALLVTVATAMILPLTGLTAGAQTATAAEASAPQIPPTGAQFRAAQEQARQAEQARRKADLDARRRARAQAKKDAREQKRAAEREQRLKATVDRLQAALDALRKKQSER